MIIPDAFIEFKVKTPGGPEPETGYPRPASVSWTGKREAQVIPVSSSLQGKSDGERFTSARLTILLDGTDPLPDSEQIRLLDREGNVIGEYSLLSRPERWPAVDQTKLTV